MSEGIQTVTAHFYSDDGLQVLEQQVAEEVPLLLVYNGVAYLVMLCSPLHLEQLAIGFSLSEGIVDAYYQILAVEIRASHDGYEAHLQIPNQFAAKLRSRRRNLQSRTACGLCGSEQLAEVMRAPQPIESDFQIEPQAILAGMQALSQLQTMNQQTGGVHAAGWWAAGQLTVFEDLGRHNALDKLIGHLASKRYRPDGVLLMTSRLSYDLIQKAARAQMPVIAAISAPSHLAVEQARLADITLLGFVRGQRFTVYTHPERVLT
ncbi:formate dehydrogenase accessory sulfurtransferase FdhD [Iodobacter sp. HSC-16F04]|uniref:Sulfur carrier protein FdhD n=1 Tax=Iodobacter violaceini TaxID=3044271 RepID=A0ABX0KZN3_9NEIS|nr:formate dehydrogenase accessory sulfurtransferase FdhD [Iodobacter violacea]NHQ87855.1 formate dehydrogenase accessory sulfurtransferase FdhD [Iodobacter violacea]